jgi:tetratricopeptide (TPR) repeat protein
MNTQMNSGEIRTISRTEFAKMLDAAIVTRSFRFLQQAVINWLAVFPGDLGIQRYQAISFCENGRIEQAVNLLQNVLKYDPEDLDSIELLETIVKSKSLPTQNPFLSFILGNIAPSGISIPEWARDLRNSREADANQDFDKAEKLLSGIVDAHQDEVLVAIENTRLLWKKGNLIPMQQFCEIYRSKWPNCLQFKLWQADSKMKSGSSVEAMNMLAECVNFDVAGQTAEKVFGKLNSYREIWPHILEVKFDLPIAAEVAVKMGWNQLAGDGGPTVEGKAAAPAQENVDWINLDRIDIPPVAPEGGIQEVRAGSGLPEEGFSATDSKKNLKKAHGKKQKKLNDYEKLAKDLKKSEVLQQDGRYPVYVILSSHQKLATAYGEKTTGVLEFEFARLAEAIQKRAGWSAEVFLPDSKSNMAGFNLAVIENLDPWKIKLALVDLDAYLKKKGEMIGALLIVGGDDIIPFHRLPNPIKDSDTEVLSDNPYSTLDGNYFIPEWPVGRLPGEPGNDAGLLLAQLYRIHRSYGKSEGLPGFLGNLMKTVNGQKTPASKESIHWSRSRNFGYTAAVWRRSSLAAFHPVGDGRDLLVSPPNISGKFDCKKIADASIAYYNLHGLIDAPEWYGQKDPSEKRDCTEYPVAISPLDINKYLTSPKVIFSEACYGAHTVGKDDQSSLALKFISLGTRAFVGSTGISYGSMSTPLIGGDLLGNCFWKMVKDGVTVGEALMKAKAELAKEMNRRQGFLDGEDQKTILSFVLYGDPLFSKKQITAKYRPMPHLTVQPEFQTVTDFGAESLENNPRDHNGELVSQAKQILKGYLPGLDDADPEIAGEYFQVASHGPASESGQQNPTISKYTGRTVVTFRKQAMVSAKSFTQYARMTLSPEGKMIKLVVSR